MKTLVAVYGSLRQGMGNHRLLEQRASEFLGSERVQGWRMHSLGAYPFITPDESTAGIRIEVYEVDETTFARLDGLEGYPNFYNRRMISTSHGDAWIYFIQDNSSSAPVVENGDWVDYKRNLGGI